MADTPRYMSDDVSVRGVGVGALFIVAIIVVALLAAFAALHFSSGGMGVAGFGAGFREPPRIAGPVSLQADPALDIARFRAEKAAQLDGYGWVDAPGIARIPIERAMALRTQGVAATTGGAP